MLWLRTLGWPLKVDETGITLRHHRRVGWSAITKIGVSRSYLDGHVSQIRVHYGRKVSRIPIRALRDGARVAEAILAQFRLHRRLNVVTIANAWAPRGGLVANSRNSSPRPSLRESPPRENRILRNAGERRVAAS